MSFIPSVLGATARGTDPTVRNTTDKTSKLATLRNQAMSRIPGLSDNLPASYDTWGEEYTRGNSVGEALASQFFVPGEFTKDTSTDRDREIDRLYDTTGNNSVFPQVAATKVGDRTLTNTEVSDYQRDMGQRSAELIDSLMSSDFYADMPDADKAETIASLYSFSKGYSENALFDKGLSSTNAKLAGIYEESGADGLVNELSRRKTIKNAGLTNNDKTNRIFEEKGDEGLNLYKELKDNAGSKKEEIKEYLDNRTDMSNADREYWFSQLSTANNPYGTKETATTNKQEETTNQKKETVHYQKPDRSKLASTKGRWTAENNYGFDWDLASSAAYGRFQKVPSLSDYSLEAYANIWHPMNTNNDSKLTPEEITAYLDNSHYTQKQKAGLFSAMGRANWDNPYR